MMRKSNQRKAAVYEFQYAYRGSETQEVNHSKSVAPPSLQLQSLSQDRNKRLQIKVNINTISFIRLIVQ